MSSLADPRERITAAFAQLPTKQRRLARFFLDHEDVVAFASANDIGERTETSAATVVRFCRALGYEGYTDLQTAIRAKFPQYRTFVQKLAERMASDDFTENLPAQIIRANTNNIQQTLGRVSGTRDLWIDLESRRMPDSAGTGERNEGIHARSDRDTLCRA